MAKRPKPKLVSSAGEIGQLEFNEAAYAHREVDAGGVYDILGPAGSAVRVGLFASLRVVNTAGAAAYIKIGADNTLTAPTGLADGHYIPAGGVLFLSTGEQGAFVRASAATVGVYKLVDNIVIADDTREKP